ncbi:methylenetetrahydrofolate reductase [NAD(P)H] [Phycicoccus endophyticus]|uniref:Methylenetetrahydrofolate reductase n=1 Tax=Phycicoccus endophyticus TaxID=1690220 RepID=A0A7G9R4X2_9MICO|nr:methylenetetrahydrofolate reductase [NAD(P)H] [Phycicoccus endophyticus]NHI18579.1 methylenetetrahydrofolate reductase [NAD(P)H] [Phycicoccus endophyticus]QNN50647.1 methylenetetrahydrofolate reductase [NAD(P)H] [Phycicoccus endophyticus]
MAHYGGGGRPEHLVASIPARLREPRPSVSFEFFPPKDDAAEAALWDAVRRLERVRPAFVSVTYGAGGTSQDRTVRVTARIADETSLTPLAHLTCVGQSVADLRRVVGNYAASGVRNVLALRGDPPGDVRGAWTPHPDGLEHAEDLVRLVRGLGDFTLGVAAFPDVHPDSPGLEHDVDVLVRKADAGAEFAITQMVFDAESYLRLRDRVAARRDLPVTPGLMPVTSYRQTQRMSELMGTPLPPQVVERLEAVKDDPAAVRAVGVAIAVELGQRMLAEGAPGLHFITMNRSTATLEVHDALGLEP